MSKHTKTPWIWSPQTGLEVHSKHSKDAFQGVGQFYEESDAKRTWECVNAFGPGGVVAEFVNAANVIRHHEESVEDFQSRYIRGVCAKLQAVRNLLETETEKP